jgi:hypothetical protein
MQQSRNAPRKAQYDPPFINRTLLRSKNLSNLVRPHQAYQRGEERLSIPPTDPEFLSNVVYGRSQAATL